MARSKSSSSAKRSLPGTNDANAPEGPEGGVVFNQYGPGEILTSAGRGTGRWVYVGWNDEFTWRMGYCREQRCAGHVTADEAVQCFREWLIDSETRYDGRSMIGKTCVVCSTQTFMFAAVRWPGWHFDLCTEHLNSEEVGKLLVDLRGLYR